MIRAAGVENESVSEGADWRTLCVQQTCARPRDYRFQCNRTGALWYEAGLYCKRIQARCNTFPLSSSPPTLHRHTPTHPHFYIVCECVFVCLTLGCAIPKMRTWKGERWWTRLQILYATILPHRTTKDHCVSAAADNANGHPEQDNTHTFTHGHGGHMCGRNAYLCDCGGGLFWRLFATDIKFCMRRCARLSARLPGQVSDYIRHTHTYHTYTHITCV